jgi:putative Holliday junction resolvase
MTVLADVRDFAAALPPLGALIGVDLGTRTIGVAVSDTRRRVASPLETIRRTRFGADAAALLRLAEARTIGGLVLGLPRNMDGSEGPRAQSTRAFARNLAGLTELPSPSGTSGSRPSPPSGRSSKPTPRAAAAPR